MATAAITQNSGIVTDVLELVPWVGQTGLYQLKAPYTNLINSSIEYTCTSVKTISAAIAAGEDPLTDIYLANLDTEDSFNADALVNHCIITLQSGLGDVITLPNSALLSLPILGGVKYLNVVLGVALSAIPEATDLDSLETEMSDLVFDRIGVRSKVYSTTIGGVAVLTPTQHTFIENARNANIASHDSMRSKNAQLQLQIAAVLAKNAQLEAYIKANLPP